VQGRLEQLEHLGGREKLRQALFLFGQRNISDGRGVQFAAPHEVFVKGTQRREAQLDGRAA